MFGKIKQLIALSPAYLPMVALAQNLGGERVEEEGIQGVFNFILNFVNAAIPVLVALAILLFIIGIIGFVMAGDNDEKRAAGRNRMIYGIIAIFVIVSVWGLVNILVNTFDFEGGFGGNLPEVEER